MKYIVQFSGGVGSWAAAKRIAQRHGTENMVLLFADTLIEDPDLYRFLNEAAANIGVPITRLADGRTPWQLFRDERFLGNTRVDLCSRVLKRELLNGWVKDNCDPGDTTMVFGIDWSEEHRIARTRERLAPWLVEAPMCEAPYLLKPQMLELLKAEGIEPPRLYGLGFPHNNCGGFCVKAGQAHFKRLLEVMPEQYAYHEGQEAEFQEFIGKPVTILKDRRGGETKPISLREFRERLEAGQTGQLDLFDWGGCGCALSA